MVRGTAYGIPLIVTANTKGAKKAENSLKSLIKNTKSFGLTSKLSIGAASVALTAFAKKSVAAALADEKAQKSLTQTLKNLGLAYSTVGVTNYIDSLQRATGVSEDELRPAFQKLLLVLGNVGQAQSALSLAMDISAGTGKDLSAVSMALAKGYSGQTTALSRLGAGLDKALLKSGDMEAITAQLSKLFAGQAQVAVKTYAGQMAILAVSATEASEVIGFALVDSLAKLSGDEGVKGLATQMESLAQANADVLVGFTDILAKFKIMKNSKPAKGSLLDLIPIIGPSLTNILRSRGERVRESKTAKSEANPFDRGLNNRALDLATKIVAKKKEAAKIDKGSAATSKLAGMFDLDAIQIEAALKGKISDLDRARLEGMAALKTKATDDDVAAIKKIEYETIRANASANSSQQLALQNTFDFYKAIFGAAKDTADAISKLSFVPPSMTAPSGNGTGGGSTTPLPNPFVAGSIPDLSYLNFDLNALGTANANMNAGIAAQQTTTVNMNFPALGFIGNAQEMASFVQQTISEGNRNGYSYTGLAGGE